MPKAIFTDCTLVERLWQPLSRLPDERLVVSSKCWPTDELECTIPAGAEVTASANLLEQKLRKIAAREGTLHEKYSLYQEQYIKLSTRSQHWVRMTARILNILYDVTGAPKEPHTNYGSERQALVHLRNGRSEIERLKIAYNLLPAWLKLSPNYTLLFIRCVVVRIQVLWTNTLAFEGTGPPHSKRGMETFIDNFTKIDNHIHKIGVALKKYFKDVRKNFVECWDIPADIFNPGYSDTETILPPDIPTEDIDAAIDHMEKVVMQLNSVVPILYAVHKELGESLSETWRFESGFHSNFKWNDPSVRLEASKGKKSARSSEGVLDPDKGMLYEKNVGGESVFVKMKRCADSGTGESGRLWRSAESEISVMATVDHICVKVAEEGDKFMDNYGWVCENEGGSSSTEKRNVVLQKHVLDIWGACIAADAGVVERLYHVHKIGKRDLSGDFGLPREDWFTGLMSDGSTEKFNIMDIIVRPSYFSSLLFDGNLRNFTNSVDIYFPQLVSNTE